MKKKCRLGFEQKLFFKFLSPPVRGVKKIEPAGQPETNYFLRSAYGTIFTVLDNIPLRTKGCLKQLLWSTE